MASTYRTPWLAFGGQQTKTIIDDDDNQNSGASTPPLWTSSPQHRFNHYGNLSPTSKAQAIARGQKELMDMVSMMPEGCFELSLRDIVEVQQNQQEQEKVKINKKAKRVNYKKRTINRSGSINKHNNNNNGGFLLKMVFPISWGSSNSTKKKKKNESSMRSNNNNSVNGDSSRDVRVSPKPLLSEGGTRGSGDKDQWWMGRRFTECEESESSSGGFNSVNSGSSKSSGSNSNSSRCSSRNSNNIRHGNGGCWPFIFNRNARTQNK